MIADVVIAGGGIVGAACAYYLSCAGLSVCLVERDYPASGTSRACDGLILLWDKLPGPELELGQASARLWAELAEALGQNFEYAQAGTIMLAEAGEHLATARTKADQMSAAGVRVEVLDGRGLVALEPLLARDLAGGVFFPEDAQVDARQATLALLAAARRRGLLVLNGTQITGIRQGPGQRIVGVVTTAGHIATGTLVCAAGVWSSEITRAVGCDLPIRPRKGHILVAGRFPGVLRHPLLEGSYAAAVQSTASAVQVALVAEMTAGGTLLLGSSREFAGFDRSVSPAIVQSIAARAVRFLPSLATANVIRSYSGLRPWSPDHLPLIGPWPAVPGLYLATGHEGAGIGLAPITGQIMAGWLAGGDLPAAAAHVRPDRFSEERSRATDQA